MIPAVVENGDGDDGTRIPKTEVREEGEEGEEEVQPGTWSIGGMVANEDMIAGGRAQSQDYLATKVTPERVAAAYAALPTVYCENN